MSEKRYQISPIELVRWAEPLFGFGEGKASLNHALHDIFIPDRDAKPFKQRLTFSYEHIEEDLKYFKKTGEEDYEELAKLRALPRERWGEVTGNYLLFWCENQGCWYARIKAEDLDQPNPVVYYNDQDDVYSWAPFADSAIPAWTRRPIRCMSMVSRQRTAPHI